MITGVVSAQREAILQVVLYDANDDAHLLRAVVDTGFDDWISLPPTMIAALDQLERAGLIVHQQTKPSPRAAYRSRLRPTEELRDRAQPPHLGDGLYPATCPIM